MDAGADVNARDRIVGWTPLHLAADRGRLETAKALINAGANVNASAAHRWTPLHLAVSRRYTELIKVLINAGADVNARRYDGEFTPLHTAVSIRYT